MIYFYKYAQWAKSTDNFSESYYQDFKKKVDESRKESVTGDSWTDPNPKGDSKEIDSYTKKYILEDMAKEKAAKAKEEAEKDPRYQKTLGMKNGYMYDERGNSASYEDYINKKLARK